MTPDADDPLLRDLGEALRFYDPVPARLVDAALGAFAWRTVDAELAELVEDSATAPLAGVRSDGGPRLLTFEAGETAVVVEVTDSGATRRLLGQLEQPRPAEVEVRHAAGSSTVAADAHGRFRVDAVPAGPVSLACRFADAPQRRVVTVWVTV